MGRAGLAQERGVVGAPVDEVAARLSAQLLYRLRLALGAGVRLVLALGQLALADHQLALERADHALRQVRGRDATPADCKGDEGRGGHQAMGAHGTSMRSVGNSTR